MTDGRKINALNTFYLFIFFPIDPRNHPSRDIPVLSAAGGWNPVGDHVQ